MFRIIRQYPLSFLVYAVCLLAGGILVSLIPKYDLHLMLNSVHSTFGDFLARGITLLGDGVFAVIVGLALLFVRVRLGMLWIASYTGSGLLVQFLKRVVFPEAARPGAFLDYMPDLNLVPGISLHTSLSFPSGHTTTAFAVLLLAGLVYRRRALVFTGMILACLAAFSRVYLSQHFLEDILAGSFVGLLSALLFYWYFRGLNAGWMDRSLFRILTHSGSS